jgi:hypothetical protein
LVVSSPHLSNLPIPVVLDFPLRLCALASLRSIPRPVLRSVS